MPIVVVKYLKINMRFLTYAIARNSCLHSDWTNHSITINV